MTLVDAPPFMRHEPLPRPLMGPLATAEEERTVHVG